VATPEPDVFSVPNGASPTVPAPPTSSLTSLSRSTQSTGSRRTVQHGVEIVKDSGSEGSDSGSELEDIFNILGRFRKEKEASTPHREKIRPSTMVRQRAIKCNQAKKKPERKLKFSLKSLVEQSEQTAKAEDRLAQIKAENTGEDEDTFDLKKALAAAKNPNAEDYDEAKAENERCFAALKKSNALEQELAWRMLPSGSTAADRLCFPSTAIPPHGWMSMLQDPARRRSAFLSGFVGRAAAYQKLPPALISWLVNEICVEDRDDLVSAYSTTLLTTAQAHAELLLSAQQVHDMFERLGATTQSMDAQAAVELTPQDVETTPTKLRNNIRWVIELLEGMANHMTSNARFEAIILLMRLSIDHSIRLNTLLVLRIRDALTALIATIPEDQASPTPSKICRSTFATVRSPVLRHQLISNFPSTTPRTYLIRRRLALSFALDNAKYLDANLSHRVLTSRTILSLNSNPLYRIKANVDFHVLLAHLSMLGVAIDSGFSDFSFLQSPRGPVEKQKEEEFNAGIDMLAKEIKDVASRIKVTGAIDMRGAEAKAVAESLVLKLNCAVRTKPKRAKDWFSEKRNEEKDTRELMEKWVRSEKTGGSTGTASPGETEDTTRKKVPGRKPVPHSLRSGNAI
jgi:hypothetical protein